MKDIEFITRRAGERDAAGLAGLFQAVYEHSSHPCKDPGFVFSTFAKGDRWYVAVVDDKIAACQGMVNHSWNGSLELARGVTLPEFRGAGLASRLVQHCIDDACAFPTGDIIIAYPRNLTMYRILAETLTPRMVATGHDGAINIANNIREYHGFAVVNKPTASYRHVVPAGPSLAASAFVEEYVFGKLGLSPQLGPYPEEPICGQSVSHPDLKPLAFGYDPLCPSDSMEITAYTGDSRDPEVIAAELDECVQTFAYARHIRLAVLIDKVELIAALQQRGFRATAYLPAWYVVDRTRYDCLLMVRSRFDKEPVDYNLRSIIDLYSEGLNV